MCTLPAIRRIGARTVIYPFASLGTPPQSIKYKGGPTRLIVGTDCDIRENVTMNTGTEEDGGVTEVGEPLFLHGRLACGARLQGRGRSNLRQQRGARRSCQIGDNVFFGGQAAVRQFVRIGEGAMIVGLLGCACDVIPVRPRARTAGRLDRTERGRAAPARFFQARDIHALRQAYRRCSLEAERSRSASIKWPRR